MDSNKKTNVNFVLVESDKESDELGKGIKKELSTFPNNTRDLISLDEMGDRDLDQFVKNHYALRIEKVIPIFDKAYKVLSERGHFSRDNAFGEMCHDRHIWIIPHDDVDVIVSEQQNYEFIYIRYKDYMYNNFHARTLESEWKELDDKEIKEYTVSVEQFERQEFKPYYHPTDNKKTFSSFCSGGGNDEGYVFSMEYASLMGFNKDVNRKSIDNFIRPKLSSYNPICRAALVDIEYWESYLDNPSELI